MPKEKYIPINALWRIRQANGLELKQVAKLLGHRSGESIAHYEKSGAHPNLKTTVKLMLIYNSDLKEMFPDLFECCRQEIEENVKKYCWSFSIRNREKLAENINSCTYEDMFNCPDLSESERNNIRSHITKLAKALSNF